jgi:tetratricopeptide (TPR) repeat protein
MLSPDTGSDKARLVDRKFVSRPRPWWRFSHSTTPVLTAAHTGSVDVHGTGPVAVVTGFVHGTVNVGSVPYLITDARVAPEPIPSQASSAPSRLLAARHEIAEFIGRTDELKQLAKWRDDRRHLRTAKLMHGPGGLGKTRLAVEFGRRSAQLGWHVVHVRQDVVPGTPATTPVIPAGADLLVIIDYAERWTSQGLLAALGDALFHDRRVRFLLLARPAGSWWRALNHDLVIASIDPSTMALDPLIDDQDSRQEIYVAAAQAFANALHVPDIGSPSRPDLSGTAWQLVLTVHMAALVGVDAIARGLATPDISPEQLSAYLLDREHAYWQALHRSGRIATTPTVMARTTYTATVTRPLARDIAVTLLDRVGVDAAGQSIDDHGICYPPTDPDSVLEPLYPDRLGEDFLALSTPGHNVSGYVPDSWASTAVTRMLSHTDDAQPPAWATDAVAVLIETGRRWPHIATRQLYPLLRRHPLLDTSTGAVYKALAPYRLPEHDDGLAAALVSLSTNLSNLGRLDEARAALDDAIDVHHRLTEGDPVSYAPALIGALTSRAIDQSAIGNAESALAAMREVVALRRRISANHPRTFDGELAASLTNVGLRLAELGRPVEALVVVNETIDIYRALTTPETTTFEIQLARALWTSAALRVTDPLGDLAIALTSIQEAVGRMDALPPQLRDTIGDDLLGSLITLNEILLRLGHDEAAEEVQQRIDDLQGNRVAAATEAGAGRWQRRRTRHASPAPRKPPR